MSSSRSLSSETSKCLRKECSDDEVVLVQILKLKPPPSLIWWRPWDWLLLLHQKSLFYFPTFIESFFLIEILFTYHKIHHFKAYDLEFLVYLQECTVSPLSNFRTSLLPYTGTPYPWVVIPYPPPPQSPGNHWSTIYLPHVESWNNLRICIAKKVKIKFKGSHTMLGILCLVSIT